jgi:tetratricopeptide (TPR) repeat protein
MAKRRKRTKAASQGGGLKSIRQQARAQTMFAKVCERHSAGDLNGAEAGYGEVLALEPAFAPAWFHLSLIERSRGNVEEALGCVQKAIDIDAKSAVFHSTLGNLQGELGRWEQACTSLSTARSLDPDDPMSKLHLGTALAKAGEPQRAVAEFESYVAGVPGDAQGWIGLGNALLNMREPDGALKALKQALTLAPDSPNAFNQLGIAYLDVGHFDDAQAAFRNALAREPTYSHALANLSRTKRYTLADLDEINSIEALLSTPGLDADTLSDFHFALGKIHNDLQDYATAFGHYAKANVLRRPGAHYSRAQRTEEATRIKRTFSPAFFASLSDTRGSSSEVPVFVVGLPRSGTSLVEQIIASHSLASGAGELSYIHTLSLNLATRSGTNYPECIPTLSEDVALDAANWYLERLPSQRGVPHERVTDKMPGNFNHVGLIARLFPNARIIHCMRDPMDVCLSIFQQAFVEGHGYSFDLGDIGFEYRTYRSLMQHWKAVLPNAIHELSYESLVANPQDEVPRLIAFCGLEWEEQCLRPHETERQIQTASNWQVRQPIYQTSRERWRRYEPYLADLQATIDGDDL